MKCSKIFLIQALLAATLSGQASAQSYCWFAGGGTLVDGGTSTITLKIVVSSVKRAPIPGRSGDRLWCTQQRSSLGGHSSNKIVVPPTNGEVRAEGYRISYRGDRVGKDRFVIERQWMNGLNGRWNKGTLIYDVDVVSAPM